MITRQEWEADHQHFEADWWGDCANTYGEETKQIAYARVMDLRPGQWRAGNHWPAYDLRGRTVLDVGGGPVSMLLKCRGLGFGSVVLDPCAYPDWVDARYAEHGVRYVRRAAEDWDEPTIFAEAWTYNVLQHVLDPEAIVAMMRRVAKRIRVFEWIDTARSMGHPHTFTADQLASWFGSSGRVVWLDEQYREIDAASSSPIRQPAWGGSFAA